MQIYRSGPACVCERTITIACSDTGDSGGGDGSGGDSKIERAVCISFQSQTQLNTFGAEFAHGSTSELLLFSCSIIWIGAQYNTMRMVCMNFELDYY